MPTANTWCRCFDRLRTVHQHTHAPVYVIILAPLVNEWHEFDDIYVHACVPMHSVELLEAEAMLIAAGLRLSD